LSWKQLHPPADYWSQEQASQYEAAANAVHDMQHMADEEASAKDAASFAEAKRRFDELKNELENARTAHDRTGQYLAALGAGLIAAGVFVFLKVPPADPDDSGD
jgi:hypothetical protein